MMKMEEPNWFPRWEDELPSPDDLIPLSQSLITPDLALAFDISPTITPPTISVGPSSNHNHQPPNLDFDNNPTATVPSPDEQPRTLKRPRLVWTPQLHKRFVDAVAHLGIKNAVPKTIMQLMSVDGLTRENVASHLQKYRLYLKRMQGLPNASSHPDAATDHLFASVPHPFLHRPPPSSPLLMGGGISSAGDHHHTQFPPFLRHHHMPAAQQYFHHPRHVAGCIGPSSVGPLDHGRLAARQPGVIGRFVGVRPPPPVVGDGGGGCAYGEDMAEKKALTLFPTNVDS